MTTVGSNLQPSDRQNRIVLRHALETNDREAALKLARADLQLVHDLAEALIAEIKPQLALSARRLAVEAAPDQPVVHLELARALILARKPEAAAEHIGQSPLSEEQRRTVFQELTRRFLAEGRGKQATATLEAMRSLMSLDPATQALMIHADIVSGGLEGAIDRVLQSPLSKEDQAAILRQLAGEFEGQQQISRMLACRQAAAKLAPGDRTIVQEYVRTMMEREGFDPALQALDASELATEEKLQVLRDLGGEFMSAGRTELAMSCREIALQRAPTNRYVLYELVHALLLTGGPDSARVYVERASLPLDTYLSTLRELGREFAESGHRDLAISCRRMALALAPSAPTVAQELIRTVFELDGIDTALKELADCDLSGAECSQLIRNLGGEFLAAGKNELALACHEEALRRAPENRYVIYEMLHAVAIVRGPKGLRSYVAGTNRSPEDYLAILEALETELSAAANEALARECSRLQFAIAPEESRHHANRLASRAIGDRETWVATMKDADLTEGQIAAVLSELTLLTAGPGRGD